MEITLVPQPTVTGYLITEKIRPAVQSFSSGSGQQNNIKQTRSYWPPITDRSLIIDDWPLPSHDFAALAEKRRNVQIVLLEVGDHRAAHPVQ
jgi:hypothetical protein